MSYIYEDREGNEHEFPQTLCESIVKEKGYKLIWEIKGGKFHPVDRGRRVKLAQDPMIEVKEYIECNKLLNRFGIIQ